MLLWLNWAGDDDCGGDGDGDDDVDVGGDDDDAGQESGEQNPKNDFNVSALLFFDWRCCKNTKTPSEFHLSGQSS